MAFDGHGMVYMTTGGALSMMLPQRLDTVYGKVLRLRDDGTIPKDNPFAGNAGARGEIFSLGHRDHLGLTVSPTGVVLNAEEGPNGGDELNEIIAGHNYGWPKVSFGRLRRSAHFGLSGCRRRRSTTGGVVAVDCSGVD